MNIPSDLKYTNDHEWVKKEDEQHVLIGITDYAQGELGDIVFVEIESQNEDLDKGDAFGSVEAVKTVSDLFMPVSGKVVEVNEDLENKPEVVNQSPYKDGWMIKVKVKDMSEFDNLLSPKDYEALVS